MEQQLRSKGTPKDAIWQLLTMLTLYTSAMALIALLNDFIEKYFPDPLTSDYGQLDSVRLSVAILVVAFPALIWLARSFEKEIRNAPERREVSVRKWLVWLTILLSSVTAMVQLVRLIYNFLLGDLTTQFALKLLVVLLVALAIFIYYALDLRRKTGMAPAQKALIGFATMAITVSVVWGFAIIGSPFAERDRRFDAERASDLRSIQEDVIRFWLDMKTLPANLDEIASRDPQSHWVAPKDPQSGTLYEYRKIGDLSFEVCAIFARATEIDNDSVGSRRYRGNPDWNHEAGRTCFPHAIDPKTYEPKTSK